MKELNVFILVLTLFLTLSYSSFADKGGLPARIDNLEDTIREMREMQDAFNKALGELQDQLEVAEATIGKLTDIIVDNTILELEDCFEFEPGVLEGLKGPHVIVDGCNLHVRNSSGQTHELPDGTGNLIVGYNLDVIDPVGDEVFNKATRTGSHNIILGDDHSFLSTGGIVAGHRNIIDGESASVLGGATNRASADFSIVCGGNFNHASGVGSSMLGGFLNRASGGVSTVVGGVNNETSGDSSSVVGGAGNIAQGLVSSILGGFLNTASGENSTISGGTSNLASGDFSSVSGGFLNEAGGFNSTIGGGASRSTFGDDDWQAGAEFEDN